MNERKGLVFTAIAVSLVGIVTGLLLGGGLLPSQAANQLYNESTTTSKTVRVVEHSHDGIPLHKHIITIVATTTETTPHGSFHNFAATPPPAQQGPITPEITLTPAPLPDQQAPVTPEITPKPTQGANEIWIVIREFRPSSITVPAGTTVTWTNKYGEGEMHTIKSDDGLFDATVLPGRSFSYTFTGRGTFSYYCEPHPEMGGMVIVR